MSFVKINSTGNMKGEVTESVSIASSPAPEKPDDVPSDAWNSLLNILDEDVSLQSKVLPGSISLNTEIIEEEINDYTNIGTKEPSDQEKIILELIDIDEEGKETVTAVLDQQTENLEQLATTSNENYMESQENQINDEIKNEVRKTRKRKRNVENWKQNVRKEKRQHGEEYVSTKGRIISKKSVNLGCKSEKCPFKCMQKISPEERENINKTFWALDDSKKSHFYSKHVKRYAAKRKRTKKEQSRKSYSYEYVLYVSAVRMKVCQEFFLNTLNISKNRIYYFFKNIQDSNTLVPRAPLAGKHKKKIIPEVDKQKVRNHILSFHPVESHYCRATSTRKYLDRNLNIQRMYDLYKIEAENPVKFHLYNSIFTSEYNISFFKPKKDLCDKCEAHRVNSNPNDEEIAIYEEHIRRKNIGNEERLRDRKAYVEDKKVGVLTFDLQNTFSLPKTNISNFFYKMKLCCYNLTAHLDKTNVVYNAIWHEFICGRGGVHIANAIIKILKKVCQDNPDIEKLILWSDSCVPQNKNSIMSFALQYFLNSSDSGNLKIIEQKFGEPGHGNVQEIDAAHSCIERFIKNLDIWSPLTLIRILLKLPKTWKLKFIILQMTPTDYKNFQNVSKTLNYQMIPYTKIKHIIYSKDSICKIRFRESFEGQLREINLEPVRKKDKFTFSTPVSRVTLTAKVGEKKKEDLLQMIVYMPEDERDFYKSYLRREVAISKNESTSRSKPTPKSRKKKTST